MKTNSKRRVRTGLLTATLAGGTIFGAAQVAGAASAPVDDAPAEETTEDTTAAADGAPSAEERAEREERRAERRAEREANMEEIASLIGVEADDMREQLRGGSTLAVLAEANDVDVAAVIDLIVGQVNDRIDSAVENGFLDAEEADERRVDVEEKVTERVNEGRPERDGDRGPRGPHGHRGGSGPHDAPADDAPVDEAPADDEG